ISNESAKAVRNATSSSTSITRKGSIFITPRLLFCPLQSCSKSRTAKLRRNNTQCSFQFDHNISCDTESQPEAVCFSCYKWAENLIGQLGINARPVVVHDKGNPTTFLVYAERHV